jgi:hypothetical protein
MIRANSDIDAFQPISNHICQTIWIVGKNPLFAAAT